MTDHLPECPWVYVTGGMTPHPCICDRLRQAEQRGYENGCIHAAAKYPDIYRDGAQAAREAVAALPVEWLRYEGGAWPHINHTAALAAIDALRGDHDGA